MEILEKGIKNPRPYESVHAAYQKTFPQIDIPPFLSLQNCFYESSPVSLYLQDKRVGKKQTQDRLMSHFTETRAYKFLKDGRKDIFVLDNNFAQLAFLGMVAYDIVDGIIPEISTSPENAIAGSSFWMAAIFASILYKRVTKYHEFAHVVHYVNSGERYAISPDDEYLSDAAAWLAMQHGSQIDRLASTLFLAMKPEYVRIFLNKNRQDSEAILNYLKGC